MINHPFSFKSKISEGYDPFSANQYSVIRKRMITLFLCHKRLLSYSQVMNILRMAFYHMCIVSYYIDKWVTVYGRGYFISFIKHVLITAETTW